MNEIKMITQCQFGQNKQVISSIIIFHDNKHYKKKIFLAFFVSLNGRQRVEITRESNLRFLFIKRKINE